ncbi:hypothetical protein, partial [Dactylosporangium darangshiense]|uniref:hypothetical protein n=1 Tax=Dactylosporangium darangshiense TaxID=579108 RepID=UPI0031E54E9C
SSVRPVGESATVKVTVIWSSLALMGGQNGSPNCVSPDPDRQGFEEFTPHPCHKMRYPAESIEVVLPLSLHGHAITIVPITRVDASAIRHVREPGKPAA